MRHVSLLATLAVASAPLAAQAAVPGQDQATAAVAAAAAGISAADIARHVGVIAHDSMMGRDTPSRGLDMTAQYLADQFARLGLRPGGDRTHQRDSSGKVKYITVTAVDGSTYQRAAQDTSWFHRYPIPGNLKLDHAGSQLTFTTKLQRGERPVVNEDGQLLERSTAIDFASAARFGTDTIPESGARGEWEHVAPRATFVVAGPHTPATVRQADLQHKIVIYVPPADSDSATERHVVDLLGVTNNVLVLVNEDSATFAARRDAARQRRTVVVDRFMEEALGVRRWIAHVRPSAIGSFLRTAGLDVARARAETAPVARELPSTYVSLWPQLEATKRDGATAANVVAVLDGADWKVKRKGPWGPSYESQQYIVVAAHMDHLGVRPGGADSIYNGANDNASGVAGLIELAKAFSQPGVMQGRGIIFVGLSGSAKGLWGSTHWARGLGDRGVVAAINLDMIGRAPGDSIRMTGLPDFEFPVRPDWIAAQHPDLRLTLVDGGSVSRSTSDHFAFVRKALPALHFYNGSHDDARPDDAPASIDAEQEARILRLVFYIAHGIATADQAPQWTPAGRRHRVEVLGQ